MQVHIADIHKRYGKKQILSGAGFDAKGGDCIGLIGKNGSGKSTLLSILAGVVRADSGCFLIDGKDCLADDALRQKEVAYVPQGTPLLDELTARDNLRMWYSKEALEESLSNGFLKMLGIDEFLDVTVNRMSGGMKKRLSIGCAIHHNPRVLLLDESSSALDLICREEIYSYFRAFRENGGLLILVTHELREIEQCSHCYLLKDQTTVAYDYDSDIERLTSLL